MNERTGRREFLAKPVQWAFAAGFLGGVLLPRGEVDAAADELPEGRAAAGIVSRTLGRTRISLPIVSLGFMNAEVPGLIRRAYELGMRHIDTAAYYQGGRNEEMVGAMIKELGVRDQMTIATKVFLRGWGVNVRAPQAGSKFKEIFDGSLKRLQMDHVDVLYYHSVDSAEDLHADGPLQALADLRKSGKIRFVGVSTHQGATILPEAVRLGVFDVAMVTINYTLASNKALLAAIDQAAAAGIGIVAMKTQAGGLSRPDAKLPKLLPPHSQTALLKWVLRNPSITTAIPGVTTYEQLEQGFTVASNLDYSAAEKQFLADPAFMAQAQFCQQCGQCRGDCPRGVDVPTLMRSHMYALQYCNQELARSTLVSLGTGRGLDACQACGTCKAICREHVNIAAKIEQLVASRPYLAV